MKFQKTLIPQMRFHKRSGQYYVWDGAIKSRLHLGKVKSEAEAKYEELIKDWLNRPKEFRVGPLRQRRWTTEEACRLWLKHKQATANPSNPAGCAHAETAVNIVVEVCGQLPVREFRAKALECVQQVLMQRRCRQGGKLQPQTYSRTYCNMIQKLILRCFAWLVKEEVYPAESLAILREVPFIKRGPHVRESKRVTPVTPEQVNATLPYCSPILSTMIQVQQLIACRPGELCRMQPRDISRSPAEKLTLPNTDYQVSARLENGCMVWIYVPAEHKTLHKEKSRTIAIGPRAQKLLEPLLLGRDPEAYIFSPREAVAQWLALKRANRQTPVQPSQVCRCKRNPGRRPGNRYTTDSYCGAVASAIEKANADRKEKGLPPIPAWAPNRLRHLAATEIAAKFDRETAAVALGHAGMDMIGIYAEQSLNKVAGVAAAMG